MSPDDLVWPVAIEGVDALPLGAMPLYGVAPEAFSLLDAASSTGRHNPPRAPPVQEAVNPETLPGCTLLRGVLTSAECEALIALTEDRIGYLDVDSGKNTQVKKLG
jgi:hypothetical protein